MIASDISEKIDKMTYKLENPNVDLHNHFWITTDLGRFGLDRNERNLDTILQSMENGKINICALTNSQDLRYEHVLDTIRTRTIRQKELELYPNCIIVNGKQIIFRGEELHTDKGDMILVGVDRTIWKPKTPLSLKEAVDIGKGEGLFILAPHPYSGHGGIGDNIEDICEDIDAIELNPNCSVVIPKLLDKRKDNSKAEKFAKENKIPIIWTSDAHWADETGRGYFKLNAPVEFSDGQEALQKIKENVKKGQYETQGRLATRYELARLIAVTLYDLDFRRPLGLVKSTFEANF